MSEHQAQEPLMDDDDAMLATVRHDRGAEEQVIGAVMLTNGRAMADVEWLSPEDFYDPLLEQVWTLMRGEVANGRPVEAVALVETARSRGVRFVTNARMAELMASQVTPGLAGFYARRVAEAARLRRLQEVGSRIHCAATSADADQVDQFVEQLRADLDKASAGSQPARKVTMFVDDLQEAMDAWSEPAPPTLSTGISDLDDMLGGGLRGGHLCIIGARPGVGKSVAAAVVAPAVAERGVGVLWASLEMSKREVAGRIATNYAGILLDRLNRHQISQHEWEKLSALRSRAYDWPLRVDDSAMTGLTRLRSMARDMARKPNGLGLIVIDYLQLMAAADTKVPRHEQVASLSRGLKIIAREFDVPVVALAQVGRGSTQRSDTRPRMSDLRESGQIEADADEIIMLHRGEPGPGGEPQTATADTPGTGEIDFIIEKNRHGSQGTVRLAWIPARSRITNLSREFTP